MTSPASPAQDRFAAALRLLFLGELVIFVLRLVRFPAEAFYMNHFSTPGGGNRAFSFSFAVLQLLPDALVAFGLLNIATRLENLKVRRWAAAAVILLGIRVACSFGSMALAMSTEGRSAIAGPTLGVVIALAVAASIGALLLTVWQGSLWLEARPPRALFLTIAGLVVLNLGGQLLTMFLSDYSAASTVRAVLQGPSMAIHGLLVGTFYLTRAEVLRTRDPQPEVSEWKAVASGLTLWLRGLYDAPPSATS